MPERINRRTVAAGAVGSVLEWYDFGVYAFLATVLATHFFPTGDPVTALIAAFSVFAGGYLMRPIGAVLFGHVGDRVGRRPALVLAIAVMAIATTAIALVPTYEAIGLAAPVLLTAFRLLQGVAVGGEYTGAVVFLVEAAPNRRRALIAAAALSSGTVGVLAASGAAALLTNLVSAETFNDWGWRLLYAPAPLLGVVGILLRQRIASTPIDPPTRQRHLPIALALRDHWPGMLRVAGLTTAAAVGNYTVFIYGVTYLQTVTGMPKAEALDINTLTTAMLVVFVVGFAWLADRIGRKPVIVFGTGGLLLCAYPLFGLFARSDPGLATAAQVGFAMFIGAIAGGVAATMCELFPRAVRYTAVSVGYGLSVGVLGGTAPLVATTLIDLTGNQLSPAIYMTFAAAIGLVTILVTPETRDRRLD